LRRGSLWAITTYFNPAGYQRRRQNYRLFRERLALPLVTVELSFQGGFELRPGDADILVQIRGGSIMWQKERLLNIAAKQVPGECRKIAWVDCDVVFTDDGWPERASEALEDVVLLHLFQECSDLPRDARPEGWGGQVAGAPAPSMVYRMIAEGIAAEDLLLRHPRVQRTATNGLAWASRREVLEAHGFYDACILGSGDRAILSGAIGKFDCCTRGLQMNARREAHYLTWARPYFETVQGRVGYLPGRVLHLWHGEIKDRRYGARDADLAALDFDPFDDIALDPCGAWRWSSAKHKLHAFVGNYFASRNEDGA
jgi:hypothetical protein